MIANIEDSEELANLLNSKLRSRQGGQNLKLAQTLGWFTKDGQIKANIPNKDRSLYNQAKWKFFLDAPFDISNRCCNVMKKEPAHRYAKQTGRKAITAEMADESRLRTQQWLKNGCNGFDLKTPKSMPMSFWTEQDVLKYIYDNKLPICSAYGEVKIDYKSMGELEGQVVWDCFAQDVKYKTTGCQRTGCALCGFGCHLEKEEDSRFLLLKETHPKMYNLLDVIKNNGVTYREAIEWTNEHLKDSQQIKL